MERPYCKFPDVKEGVIEFTKLSGEMLVTYQETLATLPTVGALFRVCGNTLKLLNSAGHLNFTCHQPSRIHIWF
jgi:hypothetical protein